MNTNQELVNTLAIEIMNAEDKETKDMYYTMIFEELEGWIKARARKTFNTLVGYGATMEDVIGMYHDSIQKVLEGQAFTTYDKEKGDFVSVVYNEVRNPVKDYKKYLQAEKRAVTNEGKSLNEHVSEDADNTLGDLVQDNMTDVEGEVADNMFLTNLLDDFSKARKDGQMKAKALYLSLFPEVYDNLDIANAFGYKTYGDSARQKLSRAKQEFKKFCHNTGRFAPTI